MRNLCLKSVVDTETHDWERKFNYVTAHFGAGALKEQQHLEGEMPIFFAFLGGFSLSKSADKKKIPKKVKNGALEHGALYRLLHFEHCSIKMGCQKFDLM